MKYKDKKFPTRQDMREEIERLTTENQEYKDYYASAMAERPHDELHCTCVPGLKKVAEKYREVHKGIGASLMGFDEWKDDPEMVLNQLLTIKLFIEALK